MLGNKMAYSIEVTRNLSTGTGTLTFNHAGLVINTKCWFEIKNPLIPKKYTRCSATHMSSKKNSLGQPREGIYLPNSQTNRQGIFIHMGNSAAWSEGCVVIKETELLKIWQAITPKNSENITVIIKNTIIG